MEDLIILLHNGDHSLVISNNGIKTYDGHGISDLLRLHDEEPEILDGATLADKVVGKGAAAIMVLGKVKTIYADVISQPAINLLTENGISVTYGQCVPQIINRSGTGFCPIETRCIPCNTAEECLKQIKEFIRATKK